MVFQARNVGDEERNNVRELRICDTVAEINSHVIHMPHEAGARLNGSEIRRPDPSHRLVKLPNTKVQFRLHDPILPFQRK